MSELGGERRAAPIGTGTGGAPAAQPGSTPSLPPSAATRVASGGHPVTPRRPSSPGRRSSSSRSACSARPRSRRSRGRSSETGSASPGALATGFAALVAALVGAALGAVAAWAGRRLAFYELAAAFLLWSAAVAVVVAFLPGFRASSAALASLEAQGTLVARARPRRRGAPLRDGGLRRLDARLPRGRNRAVRPVALVRALRRAQPPPALAAHARGRSSRIVVTGLVPGHPRRARVVARARREGAARLPPRRAVRAAPRMPATLLMTLISIGGVAIGVWALTVVLAVMSGFEADLKRKILGQTAHGMLLDLRPGRVHRLAGQRASGC